MSTKKANEQASLRSKSNKEEYGAADDGQETSKTVSMNIQDPLIPKNGHKTSDDGKIRKVKNTKPRFTTLAFSIQIFMILLFFLFTDYKKPSDTDKEDVSSYIYFQQINVMIFIGFGYLMTFLKRYSFGSITFNMMLAVLCIQWSMFTFGICDYIWDTSGGLDIGSIDVNVDSLINGVIGAATILISFGAILGRATPSQLLMMGFLEMIFYTINFYLVIDTLAVTDVGGSIVVHSFGAYFGLAVSFMLNKSYSTKFMKDEEYNGSNYKSDLFSMIGTLFLWIYWPSFNGVAPNGALGFGHTRCFVNTVLALSACTVGTVGINSILEENDKIDMVYIQNATLAGGVAMGAAADLYVSPGGAMAIGLIAGIVSCIGFRYITPFIEYKFGIFDTCGVHNLHGLPGVLGGFFSFIAIFVADRNYYPSPSIAFGYDSFGKQAGIQIVGTLVTMLIAIVTGIVTGVIITKMNFNRVIYPFQDIEFFTVPQKEKDDDDFADQNGQQ